MIENVMDEHTEKGFTASKGRKTKMRASRWSKTKSNAGITELRTGRKNHASVALIANELSFEYYHQRLAILKKLKFRSHTSKEHILQFIINITPKQVSGHIQFKNTYVVSIVN